MTLFNLLTITWCWFALMLGFLYAPSTYGRDVDQSVLAEAIFFESSLEPTKCKIKLAQTIINRVAKKNWKNTIEEVVYQVSEKGTCQFSYRCDGKSDEPPVMSKKYMESYEVANKVLYDPFTADISGGADHFINHNKSDATWHETMEFKGRCGDHWFYKRDNK